MSWFTNLFSRLKADFDGPKATAVEKEIEALFPAAITIATDISAIAPNKTTEEFAAVATKYAVPGIAALTAGTSVGTEAITLGTQILQKNHAPAAAVGLLTAVAALADQAVNPTPTVVP